MGYSCLETDFPLQHFWQTIKYIAVYELTDL